MTAVAYVPSPSITRTPSGPYLRRRPYRGPLIVVPGLRSNIRRTYDQRAAAAVNARQSHSDQRGGQAALVSRGGQTASPPNLLRAPTPSAVAADTLPEQLRAFQAKLRRLPVRTEILINSERGTIRVDGEPRHLTPREFDLLAALGRQVGDPLTRAELLDAVRSGRELTEGSRTVDVHIAHLREKLALPGAIVTIRGRGYALSPALTVRFA